MRSVKYLKHGGPEVLELVDSPPPIVGAGGFLVDVRAVSVNPIDWKIRTGLVGHVPISFPASTGRDGSGIIRATGEGADENLVGSRVCFLAPRGQGTWADVVSVPAESVVVLPDALSFQDAAGLPLAGTSAWSALVTTGQIHAGQRVLIHGASGGVGSIAVQLACHLGAHVTATCSSKNVEYVRTLGAHDVVPYDRRSFETAIGKVDLVLDLVGGDVHRRSYDVLMPGGIMVCLNAAPIEDRSTQFNVRMEIAQVQPERDALSEVVRLVADGTFRSIVKHVLPFDEFREAQALAQNGHVPGKIVLIFPE
jgi:NADPH:quinone reductase-like Zn-dependent oxidoreductase